MKDDIAQTQRKLQCVLASLENVRIVNPFAPLITLPEDLPHPRKTLLLLLNFIDIITFFFQRQRKEVTDEATGEVYIETHPDDIELAFSLLKNCLLRRADELSTPARGFYNWLQTFLTEAKTNQFMALDLRKVKRIHPKNAKPLPAGTHLCSIIYRLPVETNTREGYQYKFSNLNELSEKQSSIGQSLKKTLETIRKAYVTGQNEAFTPEKPVKPAKKSRSVGQNGVSNAPALAPTTKNGRTTPTPKVYRTQQV